MVHGFENIYHGIFNMSEDVYELETMRKKCEDLDRELNTFVQTIAELRALRDEIGVLPEKLTNSGSEVEALKKELEGVLLSAKKQVGSFEEQGKGILPDLKKRVYNLEASVAYIKNNTLNLRKSPSETDKRLEAMEEKVSVYFKSLNRQKNTILLMIALLMGSVAFSVFIFFSR